jgi:methyl-accepting chemotaxis protein
MDGNGSNLGGADGLPAYIKEVSGDLKDSLKSVVRHLGDFDEKQGEILQKIEDAFSALDYRLQQQLMQLQAQVDEIHRRAAGSAAALQAESERSSALERSLIGVAAEINKLKTAGLRRKRIAIFGAAAVVVGFSLAIAVFYYYYF